MRMMLAISPGAHARRSVRRDIEIAAPPVSAAVASFTVAAPGGTSWPAAGQSVLVGFRTPSGALVTATAAMDAAGVVTPSGWAAALADVAAGEAAAMTFHATLLVGGAERRARIRGDVAGVAVPRSPPTIFALGPSELGAGEPENVAGAGWEDIPSYVLASISAGAPLHGVVPVTMTAGSASATYQRRQNTLFGRAGRLLVSAVVTPGASDSVGLFVGGDSPGTVARARVQSGLASGAVTFRALDGLSGAATRAAVRAFAVERLAAPYVRVWLLMDTVAGNENAQIGIGPGENSGVVIGHRCDAHRLTLPGVALGEASGGVRTATVSADWPGWALGASVEYRVDGGAPVAVPSAGALTVAMGDGALLELRATYPAPVAGAGVAAILLAPGVTAIDTGWRSVASVALPAFEVADGGAGDGLIWLDPAWAGWATADRIEAQVDSGPLVICETGGVHALGALTAGAHSIRIRAVIGGVASDWSLS